MSKQELQDKIQSQKNKIRELEDQLLSLDNAYVDVQEQNEDLIIQLNAANHALAQAKAYRKALVEVCDSALAKQRQSALDLTAIRDTILDKRGA